MSGFNTLINIFICEDSIDGIFTAIYMAWEEGTSHTDISCIFDAKNSNYSFFETYTSKIHYKWKQQGSGWEQILVIK
mgnify:CR=1 FL=1